MKTCGSREGDVEFMGVMISHVGAVHKVIKPLLPCQHLHLFKVLGNVKWGHSQFAPSALQLNGDQRPDPEERRQLWVVPPDPPAVRRVHVLPDRAPSGPGKRRDPHRRHGRGIRMVVMPMKGERSN